MLRGEHRGWQRKGLFFRRKAASSSAGAHSATHGHGLNFSRMQLCAITSRKSFVGADEAAPRRQLPGLIAGWIEGGVDFIQIREKNLNAVQLVSFAEEVLTGLPRGNSKLLFNVPASPAWIERLAPFADGVHLPGRPQRGTADLVRRIFQSLGRQAILSMACHNIEDVQTAKSEGADLALFAPVFEKSTGESAPGVQAFAPAPPQGLNELRRICETAERLPVFALGGVTPCNAFECLDAGAAGVAGIRLFAGDGWRRLNRLRKNAPKQQARRK